MKILIAPDSFKDCLTARQVGESMKKGMLQVNKDASITIIPMADGGEGTVQALVDATHGRIVRCEAMDPLMRPVDSFYGILGNEDTAVIEMAAASGLEKLAAAERNPLNTSTYGTGQLMLHAMQNGCTKMIMGIGGSATNDGGAGMAAALGYRFRDIHGNELSPTGGTLGDIQTIDASGATALLDQCRIDVACDVTNPLTGPEGASFIYGAQKGGDASMLKILDENLDKFSQLIHQELGLSISGIPGSGAAGGLGGGLVAFAGAELKKGFDLIANQVHLEKYIKKADLVITGEGKMDEQTRYGKTPYGVATWAKKHNKPVIGIAGTLGKNYNTLLDNGFDAVFSIIDAPMTLEKALKQAPLLIENAGKNIFKTFLLFF